MRRVLRCVPALALLCTAATTLVAQEPLSYPPVLPGAKAVVTDRSDAFLKPTGTLREGVAIARESPTIDLLYYGGQDHPGKPWSVWGDGCVAGGKYYSAIGDHLAPKGTGQVYEYDPATKQLRLLVDLRKFLEGSGTLPAGMNYTPGKVHSRIDLGADGWLYYAGHRGSTRTTTDANGFKGEWIYRTHPQSGKTEIVATHPVPKHVIPMSVVDPVRQIFYGGTAPGTDAANQNVQFFAYDLKNRKLLLTADDGPKRCAILSRTTGRLYWDGKRYDPATNKITPCPGAPDVRSATEETPQGIVYGTTDRSADIWAFNVKTETLEQLGPGAVGTQEYTVSMDADPTGRYLYYIPGAHGGAPRDGTPVVQFDVKTRTRKVIAFLEPYYSEKYGYTPDGTFGTALDAKGEILYVTWNGMRKGAPKGWESCALTAIHIPASERKP